MENKGYTMRELKADDLFVMMKIINKIGIKEVTECFNAAEVKKVISETADGVENADVASIGLMVTMKIAGLMVARLPECKDEVYKFLASLTGMTADEIANAPMNTFLDMVMEVFKKREFADFFQRLFGSSKLATSDSLT